MATAPVQSFGTDVTQKAVGAVRAGLRGKHDITLYIVEEGVNRRYPDGKRQESLDFVNLRRGVA